MSWRRALLAGLVGIAVVGAVWELAVRVFDIREFVLLAPSEVVRELGDQPRAWLDRALVTGRHGIVGLLLAAVIGVAAGAALAASRFLEQAAQPLLTLILVAPWVAYFTSIVAWLGRGDPPVYFLVTLVAVPPFTYAAIAGMRSADRATRDLLRTVDAGRLEVLWRLRLPTALPGIFAAGRYATGLTLAAAYYGEGGNLSLPSEAGLGTVGRAAAAADGRQLWASVFATVLLGVCFLLVLTVVERIVLRWHVSQQPARSGTPPRRWIP